MYSVSSPRWSALTCQWIPGPDEGYWLRKPTKTDICVPRVLTPREHRELLERTAEKEIIDLPGDYVIEVETLP